MSGSGTKESRPMGSAHGVLFSAFAMLVLEGIGSLRATFSALRFQAREG